MGRLGPYLMLVNNPTVYHADPTLSSYSVELWVIK